MSYRNVDIYPKDGKLTENVEKVVYEMVAPRFEITHNTPRPPQYVGELPAPIIYEAEHEFCITYPQTFINGRPAFSGVKRLRVTLEIMEEEQ